MRYAQLAVGAGLFASLASAATIQLDAAVPPPSGFAAGEPEDGKGKGGPILGTSNLYASSQSKILDTKYLSRWYQPSN